MQMMVSSSGILHGYPSQKQARTKMEQEIRFIIPWDNYSDTSSDIPETLMPALVEVREAKIQKHWSGPLCSLRPVVQHVAGSWLPALGQLPAWWARAPRAWCRPCWHWIGQHRQGVQWVTQALQNLENRVLRQNTVDDKHKCPCSSNTWQDSETWEQIEIDDSMSWGYKTSGWANVLVIYSQATILRTHTQPRSEMKPAFTSHKVLSKGTLSKSCMPNYYHRTEQWHVAKAMPLNTWVAYGWREDIQRELLLQKLNRLNH